eukprot:534431-Pelagomonas_calceolata.AAC.8
MPAAVRVLMKARTFCVVVAAELRAWEPVCQTHRSFVRAPYIYTGTPINAQRSLHSVANTADHTCNGELTRFAPPM